MTKQVIVAKFGGTSVGKTEAIQGSVEIVKADPNIRVVVVSATSGTTNLLLDLVAKSGNAQESREAMGAISDRHLSLAAELKCSDATQARIQELLTELNSLVLPLQHIVDKTSAAATQITDHVLSIGERLSSEIFADVLRRDGKKAISFDARQVIRTDANYGKAEPQPEEIQREMEAKLRPLFAEYDVVVTQGFIGSTATGTTTTLGRGGSDYSAALFAEGLQANDLQIWTDVGGILTMDPRVVPGAKAIREISFAEAAEMANFGAKVLHPATLWPAVRKGIRVFVGNAFSPREGGTFIYPEVPSQPLVRAIAMRKKQTLITVSSLRMLNAHGFLERLFGVLAKHQLSVDLVTTSEVSVALTIDGSTTAEGAGLMSSKPAMFTELRTFAEVNVEEDLTLVAIIGNRMTQTNGLGSLAFGAISDFNVRLICQGASSHNLCFLTKSEDAQAVVERLHRIFLNENGEALGL